MKMDKASTVSSVCAYAASCGTGSFWFYRLINSFTPDQWVGIGVIGSLVFTAITYITNLIIKIYALKHNKNADRED